KLELFSSLRTRRSRLKNTKTFDEEAAAIIASNPSAPSPETAEGESATESCDPATLNVEDLFGETLAQTQLEQQSVVEQIAGGQFNIDDYVRKLVEPFVVAKADPRQAEFINGVDDAIAATMRKLLHHPAFQQLEAAWTGMQMLVRRLETDSKLSIHIINISKQQLADDVSGDDLTQSQLYKLLLVESTSVAGAEPWKLVVGNITCDEGPEDSELVGRVARIHAAAGSVFVAAASPSVVGADLVQSSDPDDWTPLVGECTERWNRLRALPEATHVALAMPRILGRLPYGKATDPIDSFAFEEIPDGQVHADHLWLNPAFGVATLLGAAFTTGVWSTELDHLPISIYNDGTESVVKPCAEVELILRAGDVLSASGLTAVHTVRDQGMVLIPTVRSLSLDQNKLAGHWG
ncbi:type VI secretion system contractile sheath large subunit, partial [bacterium]|nr:type VI secretion system contractile sheath large subunit [bacterium]